MTATLPDARFLFAHPAHFVALGFGSGLAPFAPGTFGTLVAIPIALALQAYANDVVYALVVVAMLVAGAWAAGVTGRNLGKPDHGSIVIDEVAAFLIVLFFVGRDPWRIGVAFLLFRVFDIFKPPPIRQLDAAFKNGAGVMADDVVAALYTLIVFAIGQRLIAG